MATAAPGNATPDSMAAYCARRAATCEQVLDTGSTHEVLKNFPTPAQAMAALGPRAQGAQWLAWPHCWALRCTLA